MGNGKQSGRGDSDFEDGDDQYTRRPRRFEEDDGDDDNRRSRRIQDDEERDSRGSRTVHHHYRAEKSGSTAALLEILPGLFFQTFGIGHIYAGNLAVGLAFMIGYWFVAGVNIILCFFFIGFITWPMCFIATMVASAIIASNSCRRDRERSRRSIASFGEDDENNRPRRRFLDEE